MSIDRRSMGLKDNNSNIDKNLSSLWFTCADKGTVADDGAPEILLHIDMLKGYVLCCVLCCAYSNIVAEIYRRRLVRKFMSSMSMDAKSIKL